MQIGIDYQAGRMWFILFKHRLVSVYGLLS